MNTDPQREELLRDLVRESSAHGPSMESLLQTVHAERQRRRQVAVVSATLAVLALTAITFSFPRHQKAQQQVTIVTRTPSEPFAIKRISDQELLDLLAGQPIAFIKSPNGDRQLLMLTKSEEASEVTQ
jgi:hypothetical protein